MPGFWEKHWRRESSSDQLTLVEYHWDPLNIAHMAISKESYWTLFDIDPPVLDHFHDHWYVCNPYMYVYKYVLNCVYYICLHIHMHISPCIYIYIHT